MKIFSLIRNILLSLESAKWFIFAAISFRIMLEIGYRGFVNPLFPYAGFVLEVETFKYLESWSIFLFLIVLFPKRLLKASDYLVTYFLFSFLTPLLVLYVFINAPREHLYIIMLGTSLMMIFRSGLPLKTPLIKNSRTLCYLLLFIGVLFVTFWMLFSGGLKYVNFDFSKVYHFRQDASDVINQGIMAYINTWATKVFGPTAIAVCLWKKRYSLALAVISMHVIWFGISSHKSVLFYPILVIFIWLWFRYTKALALIPAGMSCVVGISYLLYIIFSDIFVSSMLIRRVFFVPPFLTYKYYEFFSQNEFIYWSNSILSSWIKYPYDYSPASLIGAYLGTGSNANNSFLSTGYMHAGITGVVLYGVIVGLLFRLVDSFAKKGVPIWVAVASLIVPSHSLLIASDLPTALLTHGFGISLIVLFLLRSSSNKRANQLLLSFNGNYSNKH